MQHKILTPVWEGVLCTLPGLTPVVMLQWLMLATFGLTMTGCLIVEVTLVAAGIAIFRFRALTELEFPVSILPPLPAEGPRVMVVHPTSANLQKAA